MTVGSDVANDLPPVERTEMKMPEDGNELNVRKPPGHSGH